MKEKDNVKVKKKNKKKKWTKYHHQVVRNLAAPVVSPLAKWKYGATVSSFQQQGNRAYLILYNHQTPFDQFFVGLSFKKPVYYLATEDIFSIGWVSSLIRWIGAPIPIVKSTSDVLAVRNCVRVAREGGNVAIAPEGNRTYSGKTEHMAPDIVTLARMMGLPIALYRIEGGYGVEPRWSSKTRKGKIRACVARVIEPEEYAQMTNEELFAAIEKGLTVDEGRADARFESNRRAEYMERAVYVCPYCGLSAFESRGNLVECKTCGRQVEYMPDKRLRGVGYTFPFEFMTQWYDYQQDFIRNLDVTRYTKTPLFRDTADLYEVIIYKKKNLLRKGAGVSLYGDRVVIDEGKENPLILPFAELRAAAVLGRNKLNLYHGEQAYQFKGGKRFNALKYVNIYYRHKYLAGGTNDGKFLGL